MRRIQNTKYSSQNEDDDVRYHEHAVCRLSFEQQQQQQQRKKAKNKQREANVIPSPNHVKHPHQNEAYQKTLVHPTP